LLQGSGHRVREGAVDGLRAHRPVDVLLDDAAAHHRQARVRRHRLRGGGGGLLAVGQGGSEMAFSAAMKLMKWYPLLTLPLFVYMGYMLSESGLAEDLYRMFHIWMGPLP